jgi:hypothetical protein
MASFSNFLNQGSRFLTGAAGAVANRLSAAGLPAGGIFGRQQRSLQSNVGAPSATQDWGVKLTLEETTYNELFGNAPIMDKQSIGVRNGMRWPVTPFINMSHSANYDSRAVIHNNYPYYAYQNSQVDQITISGSFPVNDQRSGLNFLGTLHFLRTVTKMYYGNESINQGNPPPVCKLNGYGDFVYKNVPVIITNFNVELREQIDYIGITVPTGGQASNTTTRKDPTGMSYAEDVRDADESSGAVNYVPTDSLIAVTCLPIYSRNKITNRFTLKAFAEGKLANDGFI